MENSLNNVPTEKPAEGTLLPTDCTSVCRRIVLAPEKLPHIMAQGKTIAAQQIAAEISDLFLGLEALLRDERFTLMENKKVWCDREVSGLYPRFDYLELPQFNTKYTAAAEYPGMDFEGFHFDTMTSRECRTTFSAGNGNPYLSPDGSCKYFSTKSSRNGYFLTRETRNGQSHVIGADGASMWLREPSPITLVPIHRLKGVNGGRMSFGETLAFWLHNGLIPMGLSGAQKKVYKQLLEAMPYIGKYCQLTADKYEFQSARFLKDINSGKMQEAVFSYDFNDTRCAEEVLNGKKYLSTTLDSVREDLLNCDNKRANLEPYDIRRLTDLNLGHWDLFEQPQNGSLQFDMPKDQYLVARPPQMDVMTNAVCAIDFGTKSTVVACRNQDERLLRVGVGDYAKAAEQEDYENPTVIELRDIEAFTAAYRAREGRPFTEWEQMTVSHQAENALKNATQSKVYYSVFSELKQWANDKDRRMMLKDYQGNLIKLKPYAELQEGDFDPIEFYAYYLGLYINNMHRCIYLDYILSFPVTYSLEVRERIRSSFERGIRKSLPPALLKDEKLMHDFFRVYAGASEPAAYAISALQEFGLEPKKDEQEVSYAVFDFGGGTTDYDFGIERIPKDHRRNFVIKRLGRGGGNPHLGGENILALLAYEVYKDNISEMREKRIPFVLPPDEKPFAGSEMLVQPMKVASQQAHMNSRKLSRLLRDIWEQKKGYKKIFENWDKPVALFSSESTEEADTVNVNISINVEHLEKCIEKTIRAGVEDFFTEMMHAFDNLNSTTIHILLAGNSCKSPVVRKLFEEYMTIYEKKIAKKIARATSQNKKAKGLFTLHLPMGMPAEEKQKEDEGIDSSTSDTHEQLDLDKVRTGKTGVVFGLLRSRKGGRDVKIEERDIVEQQEVIFPYYLGDINRKNHFQVRIGRGISYGEWVQFVPADEAEFELYYTKEARSLENSMSPHEVKMVRCLLDKDDVKEDKDVYICKASPDTIKYAVGDAKTNFNDGFMGKIYTQTLR